MITSRLVLNFVILVLLAPLCAQVTVSASVGQNTISKSETFSSKIVALNADDTPSVDVSPYPQTSK